MGKKYIKALIKVTDHEDFAKDFRNGKLYMNELRFFLNCEQAEMEDKMEATARRSKYGNVIINYQDSSSFAAPVFCLYTIYDTKCGNSEYVSIASPKMRKFGKYAVVVTNVSEFFNQLHLKSLDFSPVNYYPEDYFGGIYNPIYNKRIMFSYQQEFRLNDNNTILIKNDPNRDELIGKNGYIDDDHKEINIGCIHRITSEIYQTDDLIFPRKKYCPLTISWKDQCVDDFTKYNNPFNGGRPAK